MPPIGSKQAETSVDGKRDVFWGSEALMQLQATDVVQESEETCMQN